MKLLLALFFFLMVGYESSFAIVYHIKNADELNELQAKPGDKILIADGTYLTWSCNVTFSGSKSNPVLLEPETKNGVVFSTQGTETLFKITGDYIVIKGFRFENCTIERQKNLANMLIEVGGNNCIVQNCLFRGNKAKSQFLPLITFTKNGTDNCVTRCKFIANIDNMGIQVRVTGIDCPQRTIINHNFFKDAQPVSWNNNNGGECIQIGQDPVLLGTVKTYSVVSDNTFTNCKAEPEVISNKASNNFYKGNILIDCVGEIVMRGGHDCVIEDNEMKGGNCGIRLCGTGHLVLENSIADGTTGIRLMYGMAKGKEEKGFYIAASNCTIKNNKISNCKTGILDGDGKDEDWTGKFDVKRYPSAVIQSIAPFDNLIRDNKFLNNQTDFYQNK